MKSLTLIGFTFFTGLLWHMPSAEAKEMWVCLKAHTGKIVQAKQYKNRMFATRDRCGQWQRMKLIDANGGQLMHSDTVSFKTPFGRYLSAQKDDEFSDNIENAHSDRDGIFARVYWWQEDR